MYSKLKNDLRRETDAARTKCWEEKCKEIEDLEKAGKMDKMYQKVKDLKEEESSDEIHHEQARCAADGTGGDQPEMEGVHRGTI